MFCRVNKVLQHIIMFHGTKHANNSLVETLGDPTKACIYLPGEISWKALQTVIHVAPVSPNRKDNLKCVGEVEYLVGSKDKGFQGENGIIPKHD